MTKTLKQHLQFNNFIELKKTTVAKVAAGELTADEANRIIQPALSQAIRDSGIGKRRFILMVLKHDQK